MVLGGLGLNSLQMHQPCYTIRRYKHSKYIIKSHSMREHGTASTDQPQQEGEAH